MKRRIKNILLINPKRPLAEQNHAIFEMFERNKSKLKPWFAPPLSLFVVASHTPDHIKVTIIDEHFEHLDINQNYDLVGITAMTYQALRAYEIAEIYRRKNIPVVMGGIHATILPDEALKYVDIVFRGEVEDIWRNFIDDFESGIEKKVYSNTVAFDLSKSRLPRYDLLNREQFIAAESYFKYLPVQATRGCPHDCVFCVVGKYYGRKIRKKPVKQVIADIQYMQQLGLDTLILFTDDNLFVDRKYSIELLNSLIPLKIKYLAQTDIKVADDPELLQLAYKSGCLMMFIGFESVKEESLSEINRNNWKMQQSQKYTAAIKKIQGNGIVVIGAFVLGFLNDELSSFEAIKNFAVENNIAGQFTLLTPIPGSRLYERFVEEGRLFDDVFWDKCNFLEMTFNHASISKKDAEKSIIWLYNEVFSDENVSKRTMHMMQNYKKLAPRWVL
jgi:radical SAM superfamily enzyme YgiQ (UPF0313 family)